jgi:hypothetical protein
MLVANDDYFLIVKKNKKLPAVVLVQLFLGVTQNGA